MAQSTYAPEVDPDDKPRVHRSPAEEQELQQFREMMGDSSLSPSAMDEMEANAHKPEEEESRSLFNPEGETEDNEEDTTAPTQGYFNTDDQSRSGNIKKKLVNIKSKKWLIFGVGGGGLGIVILFFIFLLLASSLKIPDLAQNITSYEFARLTRQFDDSAQRVTDEDLAVRTIESGTEGAAEADLINQTYSDAPSMLTKINNYRPDKVIDNLGANKNMHMVIGNNGSISGTLNGKDFTLEDPGYLSSHIPILSNFKTFKDQVNFSSEFAPALEDALLENEVGPIIRGVVANRIRKELGIGLIAWYVGKYQGENATEARITEEGDKIDAIDGGDTPPDATGDVGSLNDAEKAADTAAETEESTTTGLQGIIDNGGVVKGMSAAIGNALQNTPLQDVVNIANPLAQFVTPACIIYDGSLDSSGGNIDTQTQQQQAAFYYVASAASQQERGSNYGIDASGDGLATAANAANSDVGDITTTNAYIRGSGGNVNTSNQLSAESSADGQFTFFQAIPGLSSIPFVVPFLDKTANSLCPTLTNWKVQLGIGAFNILANLIPGVDLFNDAGEEALGEAGTEVTTKIIDNQTQSLATRILSKAVGGKVSDLTSKVGEMLADGAKNAAEIAGMTVIAKLIVLDRAGAINSGTAQGTDLANEADAGGNIQANELERTQLFGRPMLEDEVCVSNQDDQSFITDNESQQSVFNRYLSPSNTTSLLSRTAIAVGGNFNGSLGGSVVNLSADLLKPFTLVGSLSNIVFSKASAAADCDSVSSDYGNIQFGWSDDEEGLINSSASYDPVENEEILDDSGQEPAIAQKYAACFGYTYNANGDGTFDPTNTNGDLQLADGPGAAASLGTLLSSDGQNNNPLYLERDSDGNVIDDPNALCSPVNLSYKSPDTLALDTNAATPQGRDLIFRWRLEMQYDTTVDQQTTQETTTD
jgi:hypothetical protein